MSGFLSNLVARSLPAAPLVRPRLPSLYEAASPGIDTVPMETVRETSAPGADPATPRVPSEAAREPARPLNRSHGIEAGPVPSNPRQPADSVHGTASVDRSHDPESLPSWMSTAAIRPTLGRTPIEPAPVFSMESAPRSNQEEPAGRPTSPVEPKPSARGPQVLPVRVAVAPLERERPPAPARVSPANAIASDPPATSVEVTIGRVEVRALVSPARVERPAASTGQSLETYLRRKSGAPRS